MVGHRGGHTSWYNTGVRPRRCDQKHARSGSRSVLSRREGDLTGRVPNWRATSSSKVGTRETFTPEQQRERGRNGMRHISELLTAAGLTSVHDAGADRDRILAPRMRAPMANSAIARVSSSAAMPHFRASKPPASITDSATSGSWSAA